MFLQVVICGVIYCREAIFPPSEHSHRHGMNPNDGDDDHHELETNISAKYTLGRTKSFFIVSNNR